MVSMLGRLADGVAKRWCYSMHPDPMWPVRGQYQCPKCYRKFPVPWEEKPSGLSHSTLPPKQTIVPALAERAESLHA